MTDLHPRLNYACDACDDEIGNDRITCLDCESTESLERTVDFCGEQSCLEATKFPRRSDLAKPHTRMHDIVKMRKTVFAWQYPKLKKEAKERIKWAHLKLVRRDEEERERKTTDNGNTTEHVEAEAITMTTPDVPAPTVNCAICQKNVKPPCWYCIDCKSKILSLSFQLYLTPRRQAICSYALNVIKTEGSNVKSMRKTTRSCAVWNRMLTMMLRTALRD